MIGTTPSNPSQHRKPGRPRTDYRYLIGLTSDHAIVVDIAPSVGTQPQLVLLCLCFKTSTCRVYDFLRGGHTKSCGCLKSERFTQHWDGKAENVEPALRRKVFKDAARFKFDRFVAFKHDIPTPLVGGLVRLHRADLGNRFGHLFREEGRRPSAKELGLSRAEWNYLSRKFKPVVTPSVFEVAWDDLCEYMQEKMLAFAVTPDLAIE